MHRFLADEDLHNDIVRGIRLHQSHIDLVRVQLEFHLAPLSREVRSCLTMPPADWRPSCFC